MKQEIVCPACAKKLREMFPTDTPYPGEHIKLLHGKALAYFVCDDCLAVISKGDPCVAFSCWDNRMRIPYYPWEKEYIKEETP